jgi:HlyD family secretion protein
MDMLVLKAYVTEPQLTQIKIGQKVKIAVDSTKEEINFEGKITWVSAQAEFTPKIIQTKDERRNLVYAIKINVVNKGSLKIGMPASVYFQ